MVSSNTTDCAPATLLLSENLQILSLARNQIKRISGLEEVGQTLRELWLSYNQIERLDGLQPCVKLEVLYMSNNKIKGWDEVEKLVRVAFSSSCSHSLKLEGLLGHQRSYGR